MKALILAAGYGTRLQSIAPSTAKPLLLFAGKSIVTHLLEKIKNFPDLKEIIVVTNDKFYKDFQRWVEHNKSFGIPLSAINDGSKSNEDRLGSIGDIDFALKAKKINEDLHVIGGDNLFDYSLDHFLDFARKNIPHVTTGLYDIHDIGQAKKFGVVALDRYNKVVSFEEKPEKPKSSLIAMCLYYFPKSSLPFLGEYIRESKKADAAGGYINWLYQKDTVFGFPFTGKWFDIGSVESYHEAQNYFQLNK